MTEGRRGVKVRARQEPPEEVQTQQTEHVVLTWVTDLIYQ